MRKPVPANTIAPTTSRSPWPSLTCLVAIGAWPRADIQAAYAADSPSRCAILESRDDRPVVDDESTVGGVDHIGQTRHRIDDVDAVAQAQIGLTQRLPLRDGTCGVDRCRGVHPRVDGVLDREMDRRGHGVVPDGWRAAQVSWGCDRRAEAPARRYRLPGTDPAGRPATSEIVMKLIIFCGSGAINRRLLRV